MKFFASKERVERPRVCVVDDEPDVLQGVERVLSARGFEVLAIKGVIGSSNQVRKFKPHLIVLDINMPAIEGHDLMEVFRSTLKRRPRIILFSGIDPERLERIASEHMADDFVYKGDGYFALLRHLNLQVADMGLETP
jgi:DNA-binding response OmpR family regulator